MENNSSNNTWTVNFILNTDGLGGGDAVVTLVAGVNGLGTENVYEVEVLGDFVAEADTIEEAFALAEDMISFYDAVNTVTVEVEEEIEALESELAATEKISYLLSLVDTTNIIGFLCEEIDEQLELLEALENYDYDMFAEDRDAAEENAIIDMIDEALFDVSIDALIDEYVESFESFAAKVAVEEEANGNVRGPFSTI